MSTFPDEHRDKLLDHSQGTDIEATLHTMVLKLAERRVVDGKSENKRWVLAVCGSLFAAAEAREALYRCGNC